MIHILISFYYRKVVFINYAFSYSYSIGRYYNYSDLQGYPKCINECFRIDGIYKVTNDLQFITDENLNVHKFSDICEFFEPFELVLEPLANNIIKTKEAKGDIIEIIPVTYNRQSGQVCYLINVQVENKLNRMFRNCCQTYAVSQVDGLRYCYNRLRIETKTYEKIRRSFKLKYVNSLFFKK